MIIVPTEKQFDWRHAPVVLFFIILINILVYFLYQSGDYSKQQEALTLYSTFGYLEKEWPIYQDYLAEIDNENTQLFSEMYKNNQRELVAVHLLSDRDFYPYLQRNARNYLTEDDYDEWMMRRPEIQSNIDSLSAYANGLTPNNIRLHTLITHQFLHGGIMHLLGNLFFLAFCGFAVEAAIGHWRFLIYYLVGGVVAGLSFAVMDLKSATPLVGASGAISGVMAMYLAVFRFKKIEFFYWFFIFVGYFRAPALVILPFYIGKEVYSYFMNADSNVAFMAHAGGFVAGAVLISIELMLNRNVINLEYVESDQGIDPKQEKLAEIYEYIGNYDFDNALMVLEKFEDKYGSDFSTLILRYNLTKVKRKESVNQVVLQLLKSSNLLPHELEKLEKVVCDNMALASRLDERNTIALAMKLTNVELPTSAEKLFNMLYKKGVRSSDLSMLAKKLASVFEKNRDVKKSRHYAMAAEALIEGVDRGVL